ncbi:hypothetical protein BV20DRAFT_959006, partial [Pilatotrama ljubarskyi]
QSELEHRHLKRFYAWTNKIGYSLQIARHMRRAALLRALRERDDYVPRRVRVRQQTQKTQTRLSMDLPDGRVHPRPGAIDSQAGDPALPPTSPLAHHAISDTQHSMIKLRNWLVQHHEDPATKNFIPLLRDHLLHRLLDDFGLADRTSGFTHAQQSGLEIQGDQLYLHKVLHVNYTTYDMRRDKDMINPRTHPNIMMLATPSTKSDVDSPHPYLYARIVNIFHAQVRYTGPGATRRMREWRRMEFLWVRWFEEDPEYPSGFQERRLPRVRFVDAGMAGTSAFGFVDPSDVLRAAFLMPAFAYGTSSELLGHSPLARKHCNDDEDYEYYYVGM